MAEIIDIINRLSFEVVDADKLLTITDGMKKQAAVIAAAEKRAKEYTAALSSETNIKTRERLTKALEKENAVIDKISTSIKGQIANSKPLQQAISTELGLVQKLTDKLEDLRHARERQTSESGIAEINGEIALVKKELAGLLGSGSGGGVLSSLLGIGSGVGFGKQLIQGAISGLGIGSALSIIPSLTSSIVEYATSLLHADEAAAKLEGTTHQVTEAIIKEADALGDYAKQVQDVVGMGNVAAQQAIDLATATGVVNGEVYKANTRIFEAEQKQRDKKLEDLNKEITVYRDIQQAAAEAGGVGGFDKLFANPGNISTNTLDVIRKRREQAAKDGIADDVLIRQLGDEATDKLEKNRIEQAKIKDDISNADIKRENDLNRQIYEKNKALQIQLAASKETYRQLQEKEDIESVDKIVKDTQAKYRLLRNTIIKDSEATRKELGDAKFTQKDSKGNSVSGYFAALLGLNTSEAQQDKNNQLFELEAQRYAGTIKTQFSQLQDEANISSANSAFGLPDYDKMVVALDKQTEARRAALKTQFTQEAALITNSKDVISAQNILDEKLKQLDQKAYTDRLQLATEYYQQLTQVIETNAKLVATKLDTDLLTQQTDILERGGSPTGIARRLSKAQIQKSRRDALAQINTVDKELPLAQDALNKNTDAQSTAKNEAERKAADAAVLESRQKIADLQKQRANAGKAIAQSERDQQSIETQIITERIALFQTFTQTVVDGYNTIAEARQKDLDREINVREQRVEMAFKLAERGNTEVLAIEQKALDERQQQRRKAALQDQAINAALTTSNALLAVAQAAVAGKGVLTIPLIIATITALGVGFAQAQALTQSQKAGFKDGVVNLQGPGTETSDSIPANLSRGESVITAAATRRYGPMLELMNKGIDPFPIMEKPQSMRGASNETFASKQELGEIKMMLGNVVDAINGKSVNVSQTMDKGGLSQVVTETQRAQLRRWAS